MRHAIPFLTLSIIFLLFLGSNAIVANQRTVEVEGVGGDRDSALDRALRDAVRQGVGVNIDSVSTLVANDEDEEFREQTISATTGSVTSYRILAVTQQPDMWRVKIRATVTKKQSVKPSDIDVGNARVIVVAREIGEGKLFKDEENLKLALQEELVSRNFDLRWAVLPKDKAFNPKLDLLEMGIDPTQADLVIFAEARSYDLGERKFANYGVTRRRVRTKVKIQALRPDSLRIMAVKHGDATVADRDPQRALASSFERAIGRISLDFVDDLVKRLVWERNNGRIFQLVLQGVEDADKMVEFLGCVASLPGIIRSLPRTRTAKRTHVDVLSYLSSGAMLQTLKPVLHELDLKVIGFQSNSFAFAPYVGAGRLYADSVPQGAEVLFDMAPLGETPLLKEVRPGSHNVRFRCLGFHDIEQQVHVVRGKTLRVVAEMETTPAIAPKTGFVKLVSTPSKATVRNEKGQVIGTTPLESLELPTGSNVLTLSLEGYGDAMETVSIEAGSTVAYEVQLAKTVDLAQAFRDRLASGTTQGLLERARTARIAGNYEEAVRTLEQVVEADPKLWEAFQQLGEINEYELEDPSSALLHYSDWYLSYRENVPKKAQKSATIDRIRDSIARVKQKIKNIKKSKKR